MMTMYIAAFVTGGALVGCLWPWTKNRFGAAIADIVGVTPLSIGAVFLLANPVQNHDLSTSVIAGVIYALVFGIWAGLSFLHREF